MAVEHESRLSLLEKEGAVLVERMEALRQLTDHRLSTIEAQLGRVLIVVEGLGRTDAADGSKWAIVRAVGTALMGIAGAVIAAVLLAKK